MSEELQNETAAPTDQPADAEFIDQAGGFENQENKGADLAPASDAKHETKPQVEDDAEAKTKAAQEATQKVINEKTFKARQAERERDDLQAKLDVIEKEKQDKLSASFASMPDMPAFPTDEFDDNHEANVAKYQQDFADYKIKLVDKANFDAQQNAFSQQQQLIQQQTAQAKQIEQNKIVQEHNIRARTLGIDANEMQAAESAVLTYGYSEELLTHIVKAENSPLIMKHLAANPQKGFELANLALSDSYSAGVFLNDIKQEAGALKPITKQTPEPVDQLTGAGAKTDLSKFKHSKGARFT